MAVSEYPRDEKNLTEKVPTEKLAAPDLSETYYLFQLKLPPAFKGDEVISSSWMPVLESGRTSEISGINEIVSFYRDMETSVRKIMVALGLYEREKEEGYLDEAEEMITELRKQENLTSETIFSGHLLDLLQDKVDQKRELALKGDEDSHKPVPGFEFSPLPSVKPQQPLSQRFLAMVLGG